MIGGLTLHVTIPQMQMLRDLARHAYPVECCGLLAGTVSHDQVRLTAIVPIPNIAPDPRTHFLMDARAMVEAIHRIERSGQQDNKQNGVELIGIYHSHPLDPPVLSATDLAEATWPELLYMIIGHVMDDAKFRVWQIRHGRGSEVGLKEN